jgi:galactokinase
MRESVQKKYVEQFGRLPDVIVRSPGRINLIGEHTDYNNGFVLPAAINKYVYLAIGFSERNEICLFADKYNARYQVSTSEVRKSEVDWANYMLGSVHELQTVGFEIRGFNAVVTGDLPIGAGVSSSAAVETATLFALDQLFQFGIDRIQMASMAQRAEHQFSGVQCGIMDMFACLMGQLNQVIKLDCRSLDFAYFPANFDPYRIVLLNTNVKHSLSSSAYNKRRSQCEAGVQMVKQKYPAVHSLRDVSIEMLDECVVKLDPEVDSRCRYVVQEIQRVQYACDDLLRNNVQAFGKRMFETHAGLSNLYGVSCPELDFLVDTVSSLPAVIGARMMGGGFGGCTINLIHQDAVKSIVEAASSAYESVMGRTLTAYEVEITQGTELVNRLT